MIIVLRETQGSSSFDDTTGKVKMAVVCSHPLVNLKLKTVVIILQKTVGKCAGPPASSFCLCHIVRILDRESQWITASLRYIPQNRRRHI